MASIDPPPFEEFMRLNFRPGDRLYGLKKPRGELLPALEKGLDADAQSDVTMDRVNNRLQLSFPGAWRMPPYRTIQHPTDQAFAHFLMAKEAQGPKSIEGPDDNARIRRATKLGLDFTIQGGGAVHFLLDKVKMEDVVHKRNRKQPWKDVTGSELRYLHRNWERLGSGVTFYKGGQAVPAPWQQDQALWAQYQRRTVPHSWPDHLSGSDTDSMGSNAGSVAALSDFSDDEQHQHQQPRPRSGSLPPRIQPVPQVRQRSASFTAGIPPHPP